MRLSKEIKGEVPGTFVLVLFGCGSVAVPAPVFRAPEPCRYPCHGSEQENVCPKIAGLFPGPVYRRFLGPMLGAILATVFFVYAFEPESKKLTGHVNINN